MRSINTKGFTLIELLIVVAIIAILAAIAVPNFLEAQTRAKVSRSLSDLRTLATGIEAYTLDNQIAPTHAGNGAGGVFRPYAVPPRTIAQPSSNLTIGFELTTPIAYLTGLSSFIDPFRRPNQTTITQESGRVYYAFINYALLDRINGAQNALTANRTPRLGPWALYGAGPDAFVHNVGTGGDYSAIAGVPSGGDRIPLMVPYDPTNGTVSIGDIIRSQRFSGTVRTENPQDPNSGL